MRTPVFVGFEAVVELHQLGLEKFGGAQGVRDRGAIESALAAAKNDFFYANADLFAIAAAYAFHLAQAQAFLDGNKRVAVAVALAFLARNGIAAIPNEDRLYDAMIGIAERRLTKADLAQVLRELFG
ncbi:MAG: type II toxin-antitoxin system death-on-curing family toxin [Verrucomicrobiota bacterium]|nr:type II toxin-antitoxin system death-on-curing family toxin [Verrucomicrobiota bacterium]